MWPIVWKKRSYFARKESDISEGEKIPLERASDFNEHLGLPLGSHHKEAFYMEPAKSVFVCLAVIYGNGEAR